MNCLDVRRLKLTEPRASSAALQQHLSECARCAEFVRTQDAMEEQLEAATRVPVDASLAVRVMLRRKLAREHTRRLYLRAAVALFALAMLLGVGYRAAAPDVALFDASVKHVAGEPSAFNRDERRSSDELAVALNRSGARLVKAVQGNISYIHDCPVPGGLGKHIILRTDAGTITLLTMPNKKVYWRRTTEQNGYAVAIVPCKHGSVALVARTRAELASLEAQLQQHVEWQG